MILPSGADAQVRIPILAMIVVDVETVRVEVPDADEVAIGGLNPCACVLSPPLAMESHLQRKISPWTSRGGSAQTLLAHPHWNKTRSVIFCTLLQPYALQSRMLHKL
jgi:hypothetical protein